MPAPAIAGMTRDGLAIRMPDEDWHTVLQTNLTGAYTCVQSVLKTMIKRTAFAEEAGTVIVTVGGTPGKAYNPVGWELWYSLRRLYEAGEYAQVVERGRELIDANAPNAHLTYNVACCESLTGQTTEALTHLRTAVELSDMYRDYARNDSDLDAIRVEPAFEEIVGSAPAN